MKRLIVCPECGQEREHRAKGLCANCYYRQWRASDVQRQKRKEYHRLRREGKIGTKIVCQRCGADTIHSGHGLCYKCYMHEYQQLPKRKERHAEDERQHRADDPERYRDYDRKRSQTEQRKAWRRTYNYKYYRENQERLKRYAIEYRQADTARQTVYKSRRRHRVRELEATLTPDEWQAILEKHEYCCYYCGRSDLPLEMEHKIPASRNGGLTADNIVPSCGPCNRSKKAMTEEEYALFLSMVEASPESEP